MFVTVERFCWRSFTTWVAWFAIFAFTSTHLGASSTTIATFLTAPFAPFSFWKECYPTFWNQTKEMKKKFSQTLSELESSKIFENWFLNNGIWEFESEALVVSILIFSSDGNQPHHPNMISTKNLISNFRQKLRRLSFMFFSKILR